MLTSSGGSFNLVLGSELELIITLWYTNQSQAKLFIFSFHKYLKTYKLDPLSSSGRKAEDQLSTLTHKEKKKAIQLTPTLYNFIHMMEILEMVSNVQKPTFFLI